MVIHCREVFRLTLMLPVGWGIIYSRGALIYEAPLQKGYRINPNATWDGELVGWGALLKYPSPIKKSGGRGYKKHF